MTAKKLARSALIGALYLLLTFAFAPISSGLMQVRISEALCILPFFCPEAAFGLFVGCVLGNLFTGAMWMDVVFGALTTLLAGYLTVYIGKKGLSRWLAPAPAVVLNGLVVGWLLHSVYDVGVSYWLCVAYVVAGQAIACYGLGMPLLFAVEKFGKKLFL